jgi:predicted enzyme related to lactoylglutathione lyase
MSTQASKLTALIYAAAFTSLLAAPSASSAAGVSPAIGAQYDTSHVYVDVADVDRFAASFIATFGGASTKQVVVTVTPNPSSTTSQLVQTPSGTVSLFGFKTPIPYPFGSERTGYLVKDMDAAIRTARSAGAAVIVDSFPDPIGRDVVIQWPGGVNMQLYWHTKTPDYAALQTIPENRVYVSKDAADTFIHDFKAFSHGRIVSDTRQATGIEVGRGDSEKYRRVRIESTFGKMIVLVTDGHLPFPYGHETTGYEVTDLGGTLDKLTASGGKVLVTPYVVDGRKAAMVEFPGGYVAEIHAAVQK